MPEVEDVLSDNVCRVPNAASCHVTLLPLDERLRFSARLLDGEKMAGSVCG